MNRTTLRARRAAELLGISSVAIAVAAVSTLNATIFTGARVYYAMARDLTLQERIATEG